MSDDKKSWREKDRNRDKSQHRRDRSNKRSPSAPSGYKRDLDNLFKSGSDVPERFKGMMDSLKPEEGSDEAKWREAVATLRDADGFRAFAAAASAFHREGHPFPDDEDLLLRLLDHPDERVVQATLEHYLDLASRRDLDRVKPLANRLKTLESVAERRQTHTLIEAMKEKV